MPDRGAHFRKCDFQVHSPRDPAWTGPRPIADADRLAYGRKLVAACRERGLGAIAITDHHDMCFARFVRQAAAEETDPDGKPLEPDERLAVFPGMELTLNVPCQALLLFDAALPDDLFSLATTVLAISVTPDEHDQAPQPVRLERILSLGMLKDELDRHQFLRGRYTVFPNVSDGGGHTLLRKGAEAKYAEMPWVGGYVDGSIEKLGIGNRHILDGKNSQYGNRRLAVFQTSDSRHDDHRNLGAHATWVKWAVPTAEALRQACLAQESRVAQSQPVLPSRFVESLSVSNSAFMGPIEVDLNPQYNAVIGGRGTGKSTILEYLRWGLCDQAPSSHEEAPRYEKRRGSLVEDTLRPVHGRVEVRLRVNGVPHAVRRDSVTGTVRLKVGDQDFRPCTEDELRAILPIQAYSQKQLSSVSVRSEELVRFVTTPVQEDLARIDTLAEQAADATRSAFEARRIRRKLARDIHRNDLAAASLRQQIDAVRADMPGLTPDDRSVMGEARDLAAADQAVVGWRGRIAALGESAGRLAEDVRTSLDAPGGIPDMQDPRTLATMYVEYRQMLEQAEADLGAIAAYAGRFGATSTAWSAWAEQLAAHRERYQAAVGRDSANAAAAARLGALEERLKALQAERATWEQSSRAHDTAEAEFDGALASWRSLLASRSSAFETECRKLTKESGGAIDATLSRSADASAFLERLRGAAAGFGPDADQDRGRRCRTGGGTRAGKGASCHPGRSGAARRLRGCQGGRRRRAGHTGAGQARLQPERREEGGEPDDPRRLGRPAAHAPTRRSGVPLCLEGGAVHPVRQRFRRAAGDGPAEDPAQPTRPSAHR